MALRTARRLLPMALLAPMLWVPAYPAVAGEACVEAVSPHVELPRDLAPGDTVCTGPGDTLRGVDELVGPAPVSDRYVVVLRDGTAADSVDPGVAARDARAAGATVHYVYRNALRGYSASMAGQALEKVRNDPRVRYVEPVVEVSGAEDLTKAPGAWGLDRIDQRHLPLDHSYSYVTTGAGVTAYVLDSGVRTSHQEFGGRAVRGADFAGDGTITPGNDDCNGHGTHVAGILGGAGFGVAKEVSLVSVRVLGCYNSAPTDRVLAGIEWIYTNHTGGPAVVNMSINSNDVYPSISDAVRRSVDQKGLTYVVSAGNDSDDDPDGRGDGESACDYTPGDVDQAIVVGASTTSDQIGAYSNIGPCVDIVAPGSSVLSADKDSDEDSVYRSGTSMAAPHVAGAVARYLEGHPSATPAEVWTYLSTHATKDVVVDPYYGSGRYDLLYVPPVRAAVHGSIRITRYAATRAPLFSVSGAFATDFTCSLDRALAQVTCTPTAPAYVAWDCAEFVNTAMAPAPGDTGSGYVSARLNCKGGGTLVTRDVVRAGFERASSALEGVDLGMAYTVVCRAAGVSGTEVASGSYQAECTAAELSA